MYGINDTDWLFTRTSTVRPDYITTPIAYAYINYVGAI